MAKLIPLTRGKLATVDDQDYEWLSQWKWHYLPGARTGYAARNEKVSVGGKRRKTILMHRAILDALGRAQVDHRNNDGLDNRRCNLRLASHDQNARNSIPQKGTSSPYKGVQIDKGNGLFAARIFVDGKQFNLGSFNDEVLAAKIYDFAAKKYYGEYAWLKFPEESLSSEEFDRLTYKSPKTSQYVGVSFSKRHKKWAAHICANRQQMHLGYYNTEKDAARVYNAAAIKYHGSKAKQNNV